MFPVSCSLCRVPCVMFPVSCSLCRVPCVMFPVSNPVPPVSPGFEASVDRNVTDADRSGPLPSVSTKSIDWLLVFSILFISSFTIYAILRTDSIRWLIPGQEHEHQE